MDTNPGPRARRVVVKTRLVVFKQAGSRSAATHLRYIVREGVGRDGQPGQAYGTDSDSIDVKAFEERSHGDRHQFRFIVAPEDGIELHDLRGFTRHLMQRMERDLGTRLEWIAVDHWDTDNPHTHVVLRGKDQTGENLVIGREYISHGMRKRASELATAMAGSADGPRDPGEPAARRRPGAPDRTRSRAARPGEGRSRHADGDAQTLAACAAARC